nr:hypothetical protein BaRGS_000257 [Batillaria attramentaria]
MFSKTLYGGFRKEDFARRTSQGGLRQEDFAEQRDPFTCKLGLHENKKKAEAEIIILKSERISVEFRRRHGFHNLFRYRDHEGRRCQKTIGSALLHNTT